MWWGTGNIGEVDVATDVKACKIHKVASSCSKIDNMKSNAGNIESRHCISARGRCTGHVATCLVDEGKCCRFISVRYRVSR